MAFEPSMDGLLKAVECVYSPSTSNELRQQATNFLEEARSSSSAAKHGFDLARQRGLSVSARHFGLSMLEYQIKYGNEAGDYDDENGNKVTMTSNVINDWIVQLAHELTSDDPPLIRNKVGQLWTEQAERLPFTRQWIDMDRKLDELWHQGPVQQELVCEILDTLSEDVFHNDASAAVAYNNELGKACVNLFISEEALKKHYPDRNPAGIKSVSEGWMERIARLLEYTAELDPTLGRKLFKVAITSMTWLPLPVMAGSQVITAISEWMSRIEDPQSEVRAYFIAMLHGALHRANNTHTNDFLPLLGEAMNCVTIYRKQARTLRAATLDDVVDTDDEQVVMQRKLSEFLCAMARVWKGERKKLEHQCPDSDNLEHVLFETLVDLVESPFLVVSIPALHGCTYLHDFVFQTASNELISSLFDICIQRQLRYEFLPEGVEDPIIARLQLEFDTMPELHAFLGNYKRFCKETVEYISVARPVWALQNIMMVADRIVKDTDATLTSEKPAPVVAVAILRLEAICRSISVVLKVYFDMIDNQGAFGLVAIKMEDQQSCYEHLSAWYEQLLQIEWKNAKAQGFMLGLLNEITITALKDNRQAVVRMCEYLLKTRVNGETGDVDEDEKEMEYARPRELRRLAAACPEILLFIGNELQQKLDEIFRSDIPVGQKDEYRTILFTVARCSTSMKDDEKVTILHANIMPTIQEWKNLDSAGALENFESLLRFIELDKFPQYFSDLKAHQIADWSTISLDESGKNLQKEINRQKHKLPLSATKALLAASYKFTPRSKEHDFAIRVWRGPTTMILPSIIRVVELAHAFNNPATWSTALPETAETVHRLLQERSWQSGISNESRLEFTDRLRASRDTLEGLASTVRASIRFIRELGYYALHILSFFRGSFYERPETATNLAQALFAHAQFLSTHQTLLLVKVSSALWNNCPRQYRPQFAPIFMPPFIRTMDEKICGAWDAVIATRQSASDGRLDSEMLAESILRNVSHEAVGFFSAALAGRKEHITDQLRNYPGRRAVLVSELPILEPLLVFFSHMLRVQDTRCITLATSTLRDLVPDFVTEDRHVLPITYEGPGPEFAIESETAAQVREFYCTEVLRAAITSLHEPYFVDVQRELCLLIATIIAQFSPKTSTARDTLSQLPGMSSEKLDSAITSIVEAKGDRDRRGLALQLLENVRGVGIHEMGKLNPRKQPKEVTTYAQPAENGESSHKLPDYTGVGTMFGQEGS